MRIAVLVNEVSQLDPAQTTAMLIDGAARRGHDTWAVGVAQLGLDPADRVTAQAHPMPTPLPDDREGAVQQLQETPPAPLVLDSCDAVLMRTNPARDQARHWAHEAALLFMGWLEGRGVTVLNPPAALHRYASKLYLAYLPPEVRPRTLISRSLDAIVAFLEELSGDAIIKPMQGTHGQDVFLLRQGDRANLKQIVTCVSRGGFAMVQEYLEEAPQGDVRYLLLEGEPLTVEGRVAAVRRVPSTGEIRSNVSQGGSVAPAEVTDAMNQAARRVGEQLKRDGIFLAGLDFIGARIVEVNVFSPGGFLDAARFAGVDFITRVLERVEDRAG